MWLTFKFCMTLVFILLYAALSAAQEAFDTVSESKTEELAENGDKKAVKILKFVKNENGVFTCLKGVKFLNAFFAIGFGVLGFAKVLRVWLCSSAGATGYASTRALNGVGGLIIILVIGLLLYIFGDVFSKIYGNKHCENTAKRMVSLARGLCTIVSPVFYLLDRAWDGVSKMFGSSPDIDEEVTEEEIRQMVEAGEESGVLLESQREIINNIFEFDDISVSDVMNHRTEIIAVDISENMSIMLKTAIDEGFSRIPVFEDDLDNIVGIIYVKDLLKYVGKKLPEKATIRSIMRDAYHVPQTKRCVELFKEMTEKRIQMAVVVDEYGGTAGIVTLEDLIESVLGNIQDEYDDEEDDIKKLSETTFTIDGTCDIEEVDDMLGTKLPDGDYDTLGGFILSVLGRIPDENEHPSIEWDEFKFTVMSIDERRIESVKAEKLPQKEQ